MWYTGCQLCTVLLLLTFHFSDVGGVITVTTSSLSGVSNKQPLTLKCSYTADEFVIDYEWDRKTGRTYTDIVTGSVPGRTATFKDTWQTKGVFVGNYTSSLDIQLPANYVTSSFAGTYRCVVIGVSSTGYKEITASVLYPPTISGIPSPYRVTERSRLRIDCNSYTISDNSSTTSYAWSYAGSTVSTGAVLDVNNINRSQAGLYNCTATNIAGSNSATTVVDVQYTPTPSDFPRTYRVTESSQLRIDCSSYTTVGNPSATSYSWTYGGSAVSTASVFDINSINRSQAGLYTCTATNTLTPTGGSQQQGTATGQVSVDVQYVDVPALTLSASQGMENDSVQIDCTVVSNPTAQVTIENEDNNTKLVDQEVTSSRQYIIERAQCLHNGTYKCVADNKQISVTKTSSTSLNVKCTPRADFRKPLLTTMFRAINDTATMTADVIANPLPNFTWWRDIDDQLEPIPDYTVYSVHSTDLRTTLQVTITNRRDYGMYTVKIENDIGATDIKYTLAAKSSPLSPNDVNVINIASSTITLGWRSNANGGSQQLFYVDYRSEDSEWSSWRAGMPDPGEGTQMKTEIAGLTGDNKYFFQVYARNVYGTSTKVTRDATTLSKSDGTVEKSFQDGIGQGLGIGYGTSLPVIFLLSAVLIIIYCRRRGITKGKAEANRNPQSVHMEARSHNVAETGEYSGLDSPTLQQNEYERIEHGQTNTTFRDGSQHLYENQV